MEIPSEWEIETHRLLRALYDAGGDFEPVDPSVHLSAEDPASLGDWLSDPRTQAFFEDGGSAHAVELTGTSARYLEQLRRRSNDRGARRRLGRNRLLLWVDQLADRVDDPTVDATPFGASPHAWYCGEYLPALEIDEAVDYLVEQQLLVRSPATGRLGITDAGQAAATLHDADVAAYLAWRERQNDPSAAGTRSEVGPVDARSAARLAAAIRQALPALGLGGGVERYLRDLEEPEDDEHLVLGLRWFGRLGDESVAGPLGAVLASAARDLIPRTA